MRWTSYLLVAPGLSFETSEQFAQTLNGMFKNHDVVAKVGVSHDGVVVHCPTESAGQVLGICDSQGVECEQFSDYSPFDLPVEKPIEPQLELL
ncbi:MAG: hypothetical protein WDZ88_01910 [Candidatus Paceibacterota bacterium]